MTTLNSVGTFANGRPASSARLLARTTGALMALAVIVFMVCLVTLSTTINWPASLDEPASVVLPRILEQRNAVLLGYGSYLLSSLLFIPAALLLRQVLDPVRQSALIGVATALGALSGVVKPLGILRWLTAMPTLAQAYTDPNATEATRTTIALIYTTLNEYAGTLGEVLGVAILAGLWALLIGVALLRRLRWAGVTGILVGLLSFVPLVEIGGYDVGAMLTVSGAAWYGWVLALGVRLIVRPLDPREDTGR